MMAMIADGKDAEELKDIAERSLMCRNLLIDIGILATKSYDSVWLEGQREWLEAYQRRQ